MEEKVNTPEEDLVLACLHGDYLKAEKLLDTGVNPNCQGIFDTSPISAAVTHSRYDIIEMLLSRGADINIGSGQILEFTRTPLALACKNGDINMVKFLLDRGADINLRSGVYGSPILAAINSNSLELLSFLIENGVDIESKFGLRLETPLCEAVRLGQVDHVELLIAHGAKTKILRKIPRKEIPYKMVKYLKAKGYL